MPLYDFKCPKCNTVVERLFSSLEAAVREPVVCAECQHTTVRNQSAPAQIVVNGFSHVNGYSGQRTMRVDHKNGMKTTVTGNFEGFAEGLHN